MGMFDNIILEPNTILPEFTHGDITKIEWQTKGITDPCLDTYHIKNKRLIKICHEWEEIPMEGRVNVNGLSLPLIRPKKTWEVDMNHHGKFEFYTLIQEEGEKGKDVWYEYEAKFTDGELVNIRIISKTAEFSRRHVLTKDGN
jgi:hypothetical protein